MGRMSIIIVLGFVMIAGVTFIAINESAERSSEIVSNEAENTEAILSAADVVDFTIQQYIKTGNKDHEFTGEWGNTNATTTITDLNISDTPYDTLQITGTATIGGETQEINTTVVLRQGILPANNSMHLVSNSVNVDIEKGRVSGYDENMDGSSGDGDTQWGITVSDPDMADALIEKYDTMSYNGKNPIIGREEDESTLYDEPSIGYAPGEIDLQEYIETYFNHSDVQLNSGQIGNSDGTKAVYGAEDDFRIIYSDQSSTLSSDVEGFGILAINGSLSTTDTNTLDWNGIVLCTDSSASSNTSVYLGDSSSIHGSLVAGGVTTDNLSVTAKGKVDFNIINDVVIPQEEFKVTLSILGSELSADGGVTDEPTHVDLNIGGSLINQWYDVENCDETSPIIWNDPTVYDPNEEVEVVGKFRPSTYGNPDRTISSTSNSDKLLVKRNGDIVPQMSGSSGQVNVEEWLGPYISGTQITLGPSQAIYLYDYNNVSYFFPEWNEYMDWWQDHGYHLTSETYDQVSSWWWTYNVPTDDESYEYWNYENPWLGIYRQQEFIDNNKDILIEICDDRDFQDLAVLLTLHPADTVDKPVEIKYSEEALSKVENMIKIKAPDMQSDTVVTDIKWDYTTSGD